MKLAAIAEEFISPAARISTIEPLGRGNINETYLVSCKGRQRQRFVLQRLNRHVFPEPGPVMANIRLLQNHLSSGAAVPANCTPNILTSRSGHNLLFDREGGAWRALSFIEGLTFHEVLHTSSHPPIERHFLVREAGHLLARFHRRTRDLPPASLQDPLPGLHDTPEYLRKYDQIQSEAGCREDATEIRFCNNFINSRRSLATVLTDTQETGCLQLRLIHGDPKLDNILFNPASGRAIALIDLDTLKPGLLLHDLGDFLRSSCNPGGEDPGALHKVAFDTDLFQAALAGYLEDGSGTIGDDDLRLLYQAVRLIPFELGLRFLTDYLGGNVYFRTSDRKQNLRRALVQFRLTESVEKGEDAIRSIIRSVARKI